MIIVIAILIVVAAAGITVWLLLSNHINQQSTQKSDTTSTAPAPKPTPVSIKANTLFSGDVFWGRYINQWSMESSLKMDYPFSKLAEFHPENYDAWIVNLECPTVAGFSQTPAEEDATLSFNCNPDYLPIMAKWFDIVSLANNHTDNRGADGFAETKEHLDENKVQYFGTYDPAVIDDACEVVSLPVTVTYSDNSTKHQHLPIALCGYNGVFKIPPQASIDEIARYAALMPVIAMPHMGTEYQPAPDQLKTATYRAMIDQGADMVLGGHPHWVQTSEAYKGKLIVYSMGNFIFDQQANSEVTRSASINVVMTTTNKSSSTGDSVADSGAVSNLEKWLALGEKCATYKDSCLEQATSEGLKKLDFSFQFGIVGGSSADKITKPATPAEQTAILGRLNWSSTVSELQPPQSGL